MKSTQTTGKPKYTAWFATARGQRLLNREQGFLKTQLSSYKGSRALLVAPAIVVDGLPLSSLEGMVWQLEPQFDERIEPTKSIQYAGDLMFSAINWPFVDESLELIILSHALPNELADSVLMEAWRVLAPEGQLLVTAIHDSKASLFLDYEDLRRAITVIPEPLLSNRLYCSKLPLSWPGNAPKLISKFCPLHTMQWIKHKPAMVGRLQFKLPKAAPIVPVPANMMRGSMDEEK